MISIKKLEANCNRPMKYALETMSGKILATADTAKEIVFCRHAINYKHNQFYRDNETMMICNTYCFEFNVSNGTDPATDAKIWHKQ